MGLILVSGMPLQPHTCVTCGKGPRDESGNIRENVFAEAVDINWGDSVYICPECGTVIGELYGMLREDDVEDLRKKADAYDELEKKYDKLNKRVKQMVKGARAKKEVIEDA